MAVKKKLQFNSKKQNLLLEQGRLEDENSRKFLRGALGLATKKVEATRHTILSGPPGVGKTYGCRDECIKGKVKYIMLHPGMNDLQIALALAVGVYELKDDEELVAIMDDADDLIFGNYETFNKWKIALGDTDYNLGIIPFYHHPASMTNTLAALAKQKKPKIIEAIKSFQSDTDIGLSIPMDRVRFVILCNLDLEDPKAFGRNVKIKSALGPVLDRFNYKRMNMPWEHQWGWLAYVLSNTQPFEEESLTISQKEILLGWMHTNWPKPNAPLAGLRSTSYRMVRKLAEDMINEPKGYVDLWEEKLKGH